MQQARHRPHRQRTTPMHHKYQEQIAALCPIGQYKCPQGRMEALVVQWTFNCQVSPELWGAVATNSCILTLCWRVAASKVCFISATKSSSKCWGGPAKIHHLTSPKNSSKSHKLITKTERGKHSKLHHHHLDLLKTLGKKVKMLSQMVVWWCFTMYKNKQSS